MSSLDRFFSENRSLKSNPHTFQADIASPPC